MNSLNNKTSILRIITVYVIISSIFIFSILVLSSIDFVNSDGLIIILFSIILLFSLLMLAKSTFEHAYSLAMMHWFFCFIFFSIAGFIQYLSNRFVYQLNPDSNTLLYVLLTIIIWMLTYNIGTKIGSQNKTSKLLNKVLKRKLLINNSFVVFCTVISILIAVYTILQSGFSALLSRNTAGLAFQRETIAGSMIFASLLKNIVLYGFAISLVNFRKSRKRILLIIIQFFCLLIVNPIFGLARYNLAIVYMGIMLLLFPYFKKNKKFIVLFFLAFIIIFPAWSTFRYSSINEIYMVEVLHKTIDNIAMNFQGGDYDAFSMIINTKKYIETKGITYGYQLMGPLLFFIPRSIWYDKPFGSGHVIRVEQGEAFTNVSSPLIAEGLINFGLVGVILFGLLFGIITSKVDKTYWNLSYTNHYDSTYIQILYPFLLSMFFFMNRGDLLSTFSFSISHIFIFTIMFWINNGIFKYYKKTGLNMTN